MTVLCCTDRPISERFLSGEDRIVIADGIQNKLSLRKIAALINKAPSTVSREIRRNRTADTYLPHQAHHLAAAARPRPKTPKLVGNPHLHQAVSHGLAQRLSPEQICHRLRRDYPGREDMQVSHETIYQALYFQARGGLKREVQQALRTGRTRRKPHHTSTERRTRFVEPMIMITDRPAQAADRAVPGHWEGDLIMGAHNQSAIGTLVERTTRYTMLLHLPNGHTAEQVRDALITTIHTLPAHLRQSLTWDQGSEMAKHHQIRLDTNMAIYFCDPASPWQRGTNENTNGLLRQYFPKSTNLSKHTPDDLNHVAHELNNRPRKTLNWDTPTERIHDLLNPTKSITVATTPESAGSLTHWKLPAWVGGFFGG